MPDSSKSIRNRASYRLPYGVNCTISPKSATPKRDQKTGTSQWARIQRSILAMSVSIVATFSSLFSTAQRWVWLRRFFCVFYTGIDSFEPNWFFLPISKEINSSMVGHSRTLGPRRNPNEILKVVLVGLSVSFFSCAYMILTQSFLPFSPKTRKLIGIGDWSMKFQIR